MLLRCIAESSLLTLDSRNHLARVPTGTELEVPDTLPGTGRQTTIGNGNIHRSTDERRLDMSLEPESSISIASQKLRILGNHKNNKLE